MLGLLVNALTVIVGGIVGTLLKGGIPERYSKSINAVLALCVLLIGISGAIQTQQMMLIIVSMVAGTALGEWMNIEKGLDRIGEWAQRRFASKDDGFSKGFINATLLFSVGSMAVVGSMEAGIMNKPDTLMAKAALDGVSALIFASTWGPGVILAVVPLTLYQGIIALLAMLLGNFLPEAAITEMSAAGSLLIIALGINMLGMTKERLRTGNMLPAMFIPAIYIVIRGLF